jgi:transcriptional regulator with XRE-family HTH domain
MNIDRAGISGRLKGLLSAYGAKRRLAETTGIREQSITKYIKGRLPDTEEAAKIAAALGVSLDWLLHGKSPEEIAGIRQVPIINAAACGTRI